MQISNDLAGFKSFHRKLIEVMNAGVTVMLVMEHTGSYSRRFEKFLNSKAIPYFKISSLQIKRSMGLVRGKNDKIDAVRIAEYAWLRREELQGEEPFSQQILKLKSLLGLRSKMVKERSGYMCRLKEIRNTNDYTKSDPVMRMHQRLISNLNAEIKVVEKLIQELIDSDKELKEMHQLIRTVKGVGQIVGAYMICYTNNFKRFCQARKFNCYAGLAPFKYESGTSMRGRAKVSHLANKEAKTLLNLAASCAIRYDQELKKYYQKRVAEGMKKMSCLNIIRSKLVARIFAVANRRTPFVYLPLAA